MTPLRAHVAVMFALALSGCGSTGRGATAASAAGPRQVVVQGIGSITIPAPYASPPPDEYVDRAVSEKFALGMDGYRDTFAGDVGTDGIVAAANSRKFRSFYWFYDDATETAGDFDWSDHDVDPDDPWTLTHRAGLIIHRRATVKMDGKTKTNRVVIEDPTHHLDVAVAVLTLDSRVPMDASVALAESIVGSFAPVANQRLGK